MRTLEYLVDRQYRGIAWKLVTSTESAHGIQAEVDVYDMWARGPDGTPRRFSLTASSSAIDPLSYRIEDEENISEEEYEQAVHAHGGFRDTADWIERREHRRQLARDLDARIASIMPRCPLCGSPMHVKYRKKDGQPFFSCEGFPRRCLGSLPALRDHVQRINELLREREKLH